MNKPPLVIRNVTEKALERGHWWTLPFEQLFEKESCCNPDLRIAGIVGERFCKVLPYDCNLLLLTEDNWDQIIRFAKPDFILVESCFQSCTGHWGYAQIVQNELQESLHKLLQLAKKNSVPTVFWQTLDVKYHDLFYSFARNFDFVFCADPKSIDAFNKKNISASILLPAVQPKIHNPYRDYERYFDLDVPILFDGWGDLHRLGSELPSVLNELQGRGLSIFDSRHELWKKKIEDLGSLSSCVRGCIDYSTLLCLQRYAKIGVTFDTSTFTPTTQQWWSLEALCCGMAVVHNGELDTLDIRSRFVNVHKSDDHFLDKIDFLLGNEFHRRQMHTIAMQDLFKNHTFKNRLETICSNIGLSKSDAFLPLVSVYTIIENAVDIETVISNFKDQKYSNKELLIVVPKDVTADSEEIEALILKETNIKYINISQSQGYLHPLQVMTSNADGRYCMQFNPATNDPEYLENMVFNAEASNVDFFGMLPPVYFPNTISQEKNLYPNCKLSFANFSNNIEKSESIFLSGKK
jgi:hypothetical protein